MKYKLTLSTDKFRIGSLIYCLLNAYGIDDFIITNTRGFKFNFHHVRIGRQYEHDPDKSYDSDFFFCIEKILTRRELDKFKLKLRFFHN